MTMEDIKNIENLASNFLDDMQKDGDYFYTRDEMEHNSEESSKQTLDDFISYLRVKFHSEVKNRNHN